MRIVDLDSWSDFSAQLKDIENEFGYHLNENKNIKNRILYRGQSEAEWNLETTLERFSNKPWSVESYMTLLKRLKPQIESFSEHNWNIPKVINWDESSRLPCHELWVYLRHGGFPSPLLDWTLSPYIAAFFAFENKSFSERVAIYSYIEAPRGGKTYWEKEPHISVEGVHEKTHKRHFLQQSYYSICTVRDQDLNIFKRHEDVFKDNASNSKRQDALIKITIPNTERKNALSELNIMNINSFSLFQSEESLFKTLAFREIEQKINPLRHSGGNSVS